MSGIEREIARVAWETSRADESTISATGANIVARAIMEQVVGPELDRLRAEVERQEGIVASQQRANSEDAALWRGGYERVEAERDDLRARLAKVEALADEPGSGFPYVQQAALRAALASVPEPSDSEPARATGAIVTERQRCICRVICLDHCRACNYSGRDLEEGCIRLDAEDDEPSDSEAEWGGAR